jgi:hypothetical protein
MSPIKILRGLLKGSDASASGRLEEYLDSVQPYVSWYPSAGHCFRDLLYWQWVADHIERKPSIYIHTDYDYNHRLRPARVSKIFNDGRTSVTLLAIHHLAVDVDDDDYCVNRGYATSPELSNRNPAADLLDVKVASNVLGEIKASILSFIGRISTFWRRLYLSVA